jgi:hypothetical protein
MALAVVTDQPQALLQAIYRKIDEKGIITWGYDHKGHFYYTGDKFALKDKARLRPVVQADRIMLYIAPVQENIRWSVFGAYHGRFLEMLIANFAKPKMFGFASATAQPTAEDQIRFIAPLGF